MNTPSYTAGLLQQKSYRLLKIHAGKTLAEHHLTMAEWALLGQLNDKPSGLRLSDISEILAVEPPLVTRLVDSLVARLQVERLQDPTDRRAKRIMLTSKGANLIKETELAMRQSMKQLLAGVTIEDLLAYIRVMRAICDNSAALD